MGFDDLYDLSIPRQLLGLGMLASGVALILASVALFGYDFVTFRATLVTRLTSEAEIVAYNCASALAFRDPASAEHTLAVLKAHRSIIAAGIYDAGGRLFAHYDRNQGRFSLPESIMPATQNSHDFRAHALTLLYPVILNGSPIGTVMIRSDLAERDERLTHYLKILFVVFILSAVAAAWVSLQLGQRISQPITHLMNTAKAVAQSKDYSVRATESSRGDMGQLILTFNNMLSQIQERGEALQQAHDELEHRVEQRTAELAASNKELESFSYSVSHNLRTPLRAIDGYTQMVLAKAPSHLDDEEMQLLNKVKENTLKMTQLIDDLLNFSRIGRQLLEKRAVGMKEQADSVVAELSQLGGHVPSVRVHALPAAVGDANLLRQVWMNLISNAFKFTGRTANSMVEIGATDAVNETIYYVKDNGAGFDMRYKAKLFGVFQRLHSPAEFKGTGVGLAIVQRIIQKHGGRIWADAKINAGATFYFALPKGDSRL